MKRSVVQSTWRRNRMIHSSLNVKNDSNINVSRYAFACVLVCCCSDSYDCLLNDHCQLNSNRFGRFSSVFFFSISFECKCMTKRSAVEGVRFWKLTEFFFIYNFILFFSLPEKIPSDKEYILKFSIRFACWIQNLFSAYMSKYKNSIDFFIYFDLLTI